MWDPQNTQNSSSFMEVTLHCMLVTCSFLVLLRLQERAAQAEERSREERQRAQEAERRLVTVDGEFVVAVTTTSQ